MIHRYKQTGVGLVEVLVALLLLAIGVLGYSALQLRAIDATAEALNRSQATVILRGLTESIRANPLGQGSYATAVQGYLNIDDKTLPPSCFKSECSASDFAQYDAYWAAKSAHTLGMKITMTKCPGVGTTIQRQCLFAAWDDAATKLGATDYSVCMASDGIYVANAKCLMMEAY